MPNPLPTPSNFSTTYNRTQLTFAWSAIAVDGVQYQFQLFNANGDVAFNRINLTVPQATVTSDIVSAGDYTFQVTAQAEGYDDTTSEPTAVTIVALPPIANITFAYDGARGVNFAWQASGDPQTTYDFVLTLTSGAGGIPSNQPGLTTPAATVTADLLQSGDYTVSLVAVSPNAFAAEGSAQVSIDKLTPVAQPSLTYNEDDAVFQWSAPDGVAALTYRFTLSSSDNSQIIVDEVDLNTPAMVVAGSSLPDDSYNVQITANGVHVLGSISDVFAMSITRLVPVTAVSLTPSGDQIMFSWDASEDNPEDVLLHYRFILKGDGNVLLDQPYLFIRHIMLQSTLFQSSSYTVQVNSAADTALGADSGELSVTINQITAPAAPTLTISGEQAVFTSTAVTAETPVTYYFTLRDSNGVLVATHSGLTMPQAIVNSRDLATAVYTAQMGAFTDGLLGATSTPASITITKLDTPAVPTWVYNGDMLVFSWPAVTGEDVVYHFTLRDSSQSVIVDRYGLRGLFVTLDGRLLQPGFYQMQLSASASNALGAASDFASVEVERLTSPSNLRSVYSGYQLLLTWDELAADGLTYSVTVRNAQNQIVSYHADLTHAMAAIESRNLTTGAFTAQVTATTNDFLASQSEPFLMDVEKITPPTSLNLRYTDNRLFISWPALAEENPRYQFILRDSQGQTVADLIALTQPEVVLDGKTLTAQTYTAQIGIIVLGKLGAISDPISLTVAKLATPGVPAVTYEDLDAVIAWTAVEGTGVTYELILTDATDAVVVNQFLSTAQISLTTDQFSNGDFTAKVRAHAPNALRSAWQTASLTLAQLPVADTPTLTYGDTQLTINWTAVPGTSVTYDFTLVDASNNLVSNQPGLTTPTAVVDANALSTGAFTIQITALSPAAAGSITPLALVNITKLTAVTLTSVTNSQTAVVFAWSALSVDSVTYHFALTNSGGTVVSDQPNLSINRATVAPHLAPVGNYTVQITASAPNALGSDSGSLPAVISSFATPQGFNWTYQVQNSVDTLALQWLTVPGDPLYDVTLTNTTDPENPTSQSQTNLTASPANFTPLNAPTAVLQTYSATLVAHDSENVLPSNPATLQIAFTNPGTVANLNLLYHGNALTISWDALPGNWLYNVQLRTASATVLDQSGVSGLVVDVTVASLGLDLTNPVTLTAYVQAVSSPVTGDWAQSVGVTVVSNQRLQELYTALQTYRTTHGQKTALNSTTLNQADLVTLLTNTFGVNEIILTDSSTVEWSDDQLQLLVNGWVVADPALLNNYGQLQAEFIFTAPADSLVMQVTLYFRGPWTFPQSFPTLGDTLFADLAVSGAQVHLNSTSGAYTYQSQVNWALSAIPLDQLGLSKPSNTISGAITGTAVQPNFALLSDTFGTESPTLNLLGMTIPLMSRVAVALNATTENNASTATAVLNGQMGINGTPTNVFVTFPDFFTPWSIGLAQGASLSLNDILSMIGGTSLTQILPSDLVTILQQVALTQFRITFNPGGVSQTKALFTITALPADSWTIVDGLSVSNIFATISVTHYTPTTPNPQGWTDYNILLGGTVVLGGVSITVGLEIPSGDTDWILTLSGANSTLPATSALSSLITNFNNIQNQLPSEITGFSGLVLSDLTIAFRPSTASFTLSYIYFAAYYGLPVSFTSFLSLQNTYVTINVNDPLNQNSAWALWWALDAEVTVFDTNIVVYATSPEEDGDPYIFGLNSPNFYLPNLGDVMTAVAGPSGAELIPAGLTTLGGFALSTLNFAINPSPLSLQKLDITLTAYDEWVIIPDSFVITTVFIRLSITPSGQTAVLGTIGGTIAIVGTEVAIAAQRFTADVNWTLSLDLQTPVHIPGLVDLVGWVSPDYQTIFENYLPSNFPLANGLDMPALAVVFDLSTGVMTFLQFRLATPESWVILTDILVIEQGAFVDFTIENVNNVRQVSKGQIAGQLTIAGATFNLAATKTAASQPWVLTAVLNDPVTIDLLAITSYFRYQQDSLPDDVRRLNFTLNQMSVSYTPDTGAFSFLAKALQGADQWDFDIVFTTLHIGNLGVEYALVPTPPDNLTSTETFGVSGTFGLANVNINILLLLSKTPQGANTVFLRGTYPDEIVLNTAILELFNVPQAEQANYFSSALGLSFALPDIVLSDFDVEIYSDDQTKYFAFAVSINEVAGVFIAKKNGSGSWGYAVGLGMDSTRLSAFASFNSFFNAIGFNLDAAQISFSSFQNDADLTTGRRPFTPVNSQLPDANLPFPQDTRLSNIQFITTGLNLFAELTFGNASGAYAAVSQATTLIPGLSGTIIFHAQLKAVDDIMLEVRIPDSMSIMGDLILHDFLMRMTLKGSLFDFIISGQLSFIFDDNTTITVGGQFEINNAGAEFSLMQLGTSITGRPVIYEWVDVLGIPGLTIRLDDFAFGVTFEPPAFDMTLGGGITIGPTSGDASLTLLFTPETGTAEPTGFSVDLQNLLLLDFIEVCLASDGSEIMSSSWGTWMDIGFREFSLVCNLVATAGNQFTGFSFLADMDFFGLRAYVHLEARYYTDQAKLPELLIEGYMSRIQWPLDSQDPWIILGDASEVIPMCVSTSISRDGDPLQRPNDGSADGPWVSIATFTDTSRHIAPHFNLSIRLKFFTLDVAVCAFINANAFQFALVSDIAVGQNLQAHLDLACIIQNTDYFYADGGFRIHIAHTFDVDSNIADQVALDVMWQAHATFELDTRPASRKFYIDFAGALDLTVAVDNSSCNFQIHPAFRIDIADGLFGTAGNIAGLIISNVGDFVNAFLSVLTNPDCWVVLVKLGVILIENVAQVLKDVFEVTADLVVGFLDVLETGLDEVGDALRWLYDLGSDDAARILHDNGYTPSEVTDVLTTTYEQSKPQAETTVAQTFHIEDVTLTVSYANYQIHGEWTAVPNATLYNLSVVNANGDVVGVPQTGLTTLTGNVPIHFADAGQTLTVSLSIGISQNDSRGNRITVFYLKTATIAIPPNANLTVGFSNSQLVIGWDVVTGATYDFSVQRSDGTFLVPQQNTTNTQFAVPLGDNDLNAVYTVSVRVDLGGINGNWVIQTITIAPNPSGITMTYSDFVLLTSWVAPQSGSFSYNFTLVNNSGAVIVPLQTGLTNPQFSTTLTNDQANAIYIAKVNVVSGGVPGNEADGTINIPPNVADLAVFYDNGVAQVTWTDLNVPPSTAYTYDLQVIQTDGHPLFPPETGLSVATFAATLEAIWAGASYTVQVRAVANNVAGNWASVALNIPPNLVNLALTYRDLTVNATWLDFNNPPQGMAPLAIPVTYEFQLLDSAGTSTGVLQSREPAQALAAVLLTSDQADATYTAQGRTIAGEVKGNWVSLPLTIPANVAGLALSYAETMLTAVWTDLNVEGSPLFLYDFEVYDTNGVQIGLAQINLNAPTASVEIPHAMAGDTYTVKVRSVSGGVAGNWVTAVLHIPQNINNLVLSYTDFVLQASWTDWNNTVPAPDSPYTYNAQLLAADGTVLDTKNGLTTAVYTFTLTTEQANASYTVQVQPVVDGVVGNPLNVAITIPANLSGLAFTYNDHTLVATWADANTGRDPSILPVLYDFQILGDDGLLAQQGLTNLTAPTATLTLNDDFAGETYTLQVRPVVGTTDGNWLTIPFALPPNLTNLAATYANYTLTTTWTDLNSGETAVYAYDFQMVNAVTGDVLANGQTGLAVATAVTPLNDADAGNIYTLQVRATANGMNGNWNNLTFAVPPNPTTITFSYENSNLRLQWADYNILTNRVGLPRLAEYTPTYTYNAQITDSNSQPLGTVLTASSESELLVPLTLEQAGANYIGLIQVLQDGVAGNPFTRTIAVPPNVTGLLVGYDRANLDIQVQWTDLNPVPAPGTEGTLLYTYTFQLYNAEGVLLSEQIGLTGNSAEFYSDNIQDGQFTAWVKAVSVSNAVSGNWTQASLIVPTKVSGVFLNYVNYQLQISWTDMNLLAGNVNTGTFTYDVQLIDPDGDLVGSRITGLTTASAAMTLTDAQAGNPYTVQIRAVANGVNGRWANTPVTIPPNVTGLLAWYDSGITVAMWDNSLTATGYDFQLLDSRNQPVSLQPNLSDPNIKLGQALGAGFTYSAQARTHLGNLVGNWKGVSFTVPPSIVGLKLDYLGATLTAVWQDVNTPPTTTYAYDVRLTAPHHQTQDQHGLLVAQAIFTLGNLSSETSYTVTVRATNGLLVGDWTSQTLDILSLVDMADDLYKQGVSVSLAAVQLRAVYPDTSADTMALVLSGIYDLKDPTKDLYSLTFALKTANYALLEITPALRLVYPALTPAQLGDVVTAVFDPQPQQMALQLAQDGFSMQDTANELIEQFGQLPVEEMAELLKQAYSLSDPSQAAVPLANALAGVGYNPADVADGLQTAFPNITETQLNNAIYVAFEPAMLAQAQTLIAQGDSLTAVAVKLNNRYRGISATILARVLQMAFQLTDPATSANELAIALAAAGVPLLNMTPALRMVFPNLTPSQLTAAINAAFG